MTVRDAATTLVGLVVIYSVALAVWIAASPRILLESIGEGQGIAIATGSSAAGVQLVMLALLLVGASVAGALLLWRRHAGLRTPRGVFLAMLNVGAMSALAAVVASPISDWLTGPDPDAAEGSVVALSPMVGPLYYGPLLPGAPIVDWQQLPGFVSWLVLGAAAAAMTLFYLVYVGAARELGSGASTAEREAELERRVDEELAGDVAPTSDAEQTGDTDPAGGATQADPGGRSAAN